MNRRLEMQNAARQFGTYAAIALVVVVGLIALSASYAGNRTYLPQVATDVMTLRKATPSAAGVSLEALLPYLNAVRAVADSVNSFQDDTPWRKRWRLLRPIALDPSLVTQARSAIRQTSIPQIMYGSLQRAYSGESKDDLRLDIISGVGIEKVFRRKSGRRLSEPIPSFYTAKVFKEVTGAGMIPLLKQLVAGESVWGTGGGVSVASWPRLTAQVTELYERGYSNTWDVILSDLEIPPFLTVDQYADALGTLVGPTSPLRGVLRTVVENTALVPASSEAGAPAGTSPSISTRLTEGAKDLFTATQKKITGTSSTSAGTLVTQHFQPIHRLMSGAPAPIDRILDQIRKIRDQLLKLGPQVRGANPLSALSDPALLDLWRGLQRDAANLPPPVNALVAQIARRTGRSVSSDDPPPQPGR